MNIKIKKGLQFSGIFISVLMVNSAPLQAMESHSEPANPQFRTIEQPLSTKMAVTAGGLALIGLELWWFLFSKPKAKKATLNQDTQELEILVDGGYQPNRITVQSGKKVRLNFIRKDPSHCLDKVLFPDFNIAEDLPLNQTTTIEFIPEKSGEYTFSCGLNMVRGVLEVQPQ